MRFPLPRATTLCGSLIAVCLSAAHASDPARQAEVAASGAMVMPFALDATTHVFSKTPTGGVEEVIVKRSTDDPQRQLIRQHLVSIAEHFRHGDFTEPARIHGPQMPGLAELQKAGPGEISVAYQDLPNGGQIRFVTRNPALVTAIHTWFDAQLADHGHDAMAGHHHPSATPDQ